MNVSSTTLVTGVVIFVLAVFLGFELITRVPSTLHTPLMSATNAIHGVVLVGAMVVAAEADDALGDVIAVAAVTLATLNVVGGYVVTDRMLGMFRSPASRARQKADPHG